jgi:hypothetical protein
MLYANHRRLFCAQFKQRNKFTEQNYYYHGGKSYQFINPTFKQPSYNIAGTYIVCRTNDPTNYCIKFNKHYNTEFDEGNIQYNELALC